MFYVVCRAGDAVPWRPLGHTVQRLVPRGGTDLLTLDRHSTQNGDSRYMRTTTGEQRNNTVVVGRSLPRSVSRSLAPIGDD